MKTDYPLFFGDTFVPRLFKRSMSVENIRNAEPKPKFNRFSEISVALELFMEDNGDEVEEQKIQQANTPTHERKLEPNGKKGSFSADAEEISPSRSKPIPIPLQRIMTPIEISPSSKKKIRTRSAKFGTVYGQKGFPSETQENDLNGVAASPSDSKKMKSTEPQLRKWKLKDLEWKKYRADLEDIQVLDVSESFSTQRSLRKTVSSQDFYTALFNPSTPPSEIPTAVNPPTERKWKSKTTKFGNLDDIKIYHKLLRLKESASAIPTSL